MKTGMVSNCTASPAVISLSTWLRQVGVTACTAWRWRKKGWLITVNICGRQYLTQEAIENFTERAKRGEFAQEHKVPTRNLMFS
jgi:predicted site-specific integrase-resolvase